MRIFQKHYSADWSRGTMRVAGNTEIKVWLRQVGVIQSRYSIRKKWKQGSDGRTKVLTCGCHGKRRSGCTASHIWSACVSSCVFCGSSSKLRWQTVWSQSLRIKHFVRSTSWDWGYGHTEKSAWLLCSLLLVFSFPVESSCLPEVSEMRYYASERWRGLILG